MNDEQLSKLYWTLDIEELEDRLALCHPDYEGKTIPFFGASKIIKEEISTAQKKEVIQLVYDFIHNNKSALHNWICVEKNYCKWKEELKEEGWQIAFSLSDAILGMALQIPIPITLLSVYLVKAKILDKVCNCK